MISAEWVNAIATMAAVLVAFYGVLVARNQLSGLRDTLRTDSLMAVLAIESELSERKEKCDTITEKIKRLANQANPDATEMKLLKESLDSAVENWLNALERLCFCVNKSYVPEKDWRAEYRDYIAEAIRANKTFFEADTRYTNILKLHSKWRSE
jgi:CII-binding regulator of phage lambda lysogenization HflD